MIDQATIDRIIDAAEISEVVGEFVTLKRRGVNMIGNCPFHNEKTPSFTVSPTKGIFKCFGCGKGGNSVNFIMEHETLSYPEALKWLARKYHIEVKEEEESPEQKQQKDDRESMMIVSAWAQKYFSRYLLQENEGRAVGLSYIRERGIRDDIVKKFELGFCPDGKNVFTQEAQKQGYKMEYLERTGLTIKRDDWVRDRFAGRVMFPIHNIAGRVIAFGGRTLKADKNIAKYLNSPESDIYHKSRVLYGIYQAKREISRADKCYLVEGYTDVLSMHQAGIENVVASSGTALTHDQIRLIKRFTPNITIIYDGDAAGIKASLRGIDLVLEEGVNVKVLLLPDGEDPDSFARSMSSSQLTAYIEENETDFIRFKTKLLMKGAANDPIEKSRLVNDIVRSIAIVPDAITRSIYIQDCSRLMAVQEEVLYTQVRKIIHKHTEELQKKSYRDRNYKQQQEPAPDFFFDEPATASAKPVTPLKPQFTCEVEEREIIRILLKYFNEEVFEEEDEQGEPISITVGQFVLEELDNDGLVSDNALINHVLDLFAENLENPDFKPQSFFIRNSNPEVSQLATDLLADKYIESKRWKKGGAFVEEEHEILDLLVPKIVQEYKLSKVRQMLRSLEKDIQASYAANDDDKLMNCLNQVHNIKKIEKALSEQLGNRTIL
ncbi:DNA primase [Mangrovibacterium marinum]|uniref:DNA primase n=1 Tax=Mangrovibacterium marinum TaxID=1639118 RepID=A0A2T5C2V5_9BACT|nr:DNA primase [Mangrovibacterium marinum]PTN09056.1 DNA primase [Mangrovibacterium marinum]